MSNHGRLLKFFMVVSFYRTGNHKTSQFKFLRSRKTIDSEI